MRSKTLTLRGKSVFVTGGSGFVGSHLVDLLITEKPFLVVVVDNKAKAKRGNLAEALKKTKNLEIVQADVSNFSSIEKLLIKYKPNVVFHLATLALIDSLYRPWETVTNNVKMATNLLELQRRKLFETLIQISSSEAYGTAEIIPMGEDHPLHPTTPYGASKTAADLIALSYYQTFGNDLTIVRPFNQYGPRQNLALRGVITSTLEALLVDKQPIVFGTGEQTRDFLFVKDTVRGMIDAYKYPSTRGRIVNLGSGKMIKIKDLVTKLIKISGKSVKIRFEGPRVADVKNHCADIRLARKLMGWYPQVEQNEGLRETYEWYKAMKSK